MGTIKQMSMRQGRRAGFFAAVALIGVLWLPASLAQSGPGKLSVAPETGVAKAEVGSSAYWRALVPQAQQIGQGQFRRFGFLIYDASLWASDGEYRPSAPFALRLRYARNISRDQIVDASIEQMRRLQPDAASRPGWKTQLEDALADVRPGDVLTGVQVPGQGGVIFHNGVKLGSLDDDLARAFFAIWLDPQTSEPALRAALLGAEGQ